jgi:uncharacterized protein YunC (DUF1805 family)
MKYAAVILATAALAACDGLSVAQKKPDVRAVPVAAQKVDDVAPTDHRLEADKLLAARVKAALEREDKALAANIDVIAESGTVTLWGTTSVDESARVGKVALRVEGVKSIDNKIVVVKGS